jgi:hypothetical protein
MSKSTIGILKMRRHSDLSKLTVAYCTFGLIMVLAQVAFSAEICATTYKEVEASNSALLKAGMKVIKDEGFRNRSNGTHLEFLKGDQIMVKSQTTTGFLDNTFKTDTGVIKICDRDGALSISSFLTGGETNIEFLDKDCFKLSGGLASLAGERAIFCHGTVPEHVQAVRLEAEKEQRAKSVATQTPANKSTVE